MSRSTVDLRSDTVTRPTRGMLDAMVSAELGDDVFGDDPTAKALEARVADLAGKDAAVFVPSGTMGNQIAVMSHIGHGDEVLVEQDSHVFFYEQGGIAANAGGLAHVYAGERGVPPASLVKDGLAEKSADDHLAALRLICVENTHNRHGGAIVPLERLHALYADARAHGVRVHMDGARLWNASVASGVPIRTWAANADTVMMCFSKGLGAPVGSILCGAGDTIRAARRNRKRLGGGMRQVGVLAAACLYALDHHVERLAEDHRRARALASGLRGAPGISVPEPDTNIVFVHLDHPSLEAGAVVEALAARDVRVLDFGPRRLRAITHLDVDDAGIARAIEVFHAVADAAVGSSAVGGR